MDFCILTYLHFLVQIAYFAIFICTPEHNGGDNSKIVYESYRTNTNLLMNTKNYTAPFVSITWHQNELLSCVVYSHCPTNDSHNKCTGSCCLPCNYVSKPFGILQRVIRSQRVCILFGHSKSGYLFLLEKFVAKFLDLFLNFQI